MKRHFTCFPPFDGASPYATKGSVHKDDSQNGCFLMPPFEAEIFPSASFLSCCFLWSLRSCPQFGRPWVSTHSFLYLSPPPSLFAFSFRGDLRIFDFASSAWVFPSLSSWGLHLTFPIQTSPLPRQENEGWVSPSAPALPLTFLCNSRTILLLTSPSGRSHDVFLLLGNSFICPFTLKGGRRPTPPPPPPPPPFPFTTVFASACPRL